MDPLQDNPGAPVIPAGTKQTGGVAYDPLQAALANQGQGQPLPGVVPNSQTAQPNAPVGTTFAELAAKKGFSNPDDLARSYMELEQHNKKVEMTAADIVKAVYDANPTAAPVPPLPVVPNYQQQGEDQAIKIVEAIVDAKTKPLKEELEVQKLFAQNPDAKDFATGIAQAVKDNPGISWQAAYKLAKFDAAEQRARDAGRQDAVQTQQLKQTVMAGSPTPTQQRGGPDLSSIIKDRNVPFSEVTKVLKEAGYFN